MRKVRSGDTSGTSGVSDSIVELNEFATYLKTTQSHKVGPCLRTQEGKYC